MFKYNRCMHWDHPPPEQVAAWFPEDRKWPKRPKVHFMNDCPEEWEYNGQRITRDLVMELVNDAWRNCFDTAWFRRTSDIRVEFEGVPSEGAWV